MEKIEDGFNQLDKLERLAESYRRRLGLRMELPPVKGGRRFSLLVLMGFFRKKGETDSDFSIRKESGV